MTVRIIIVRIGTKLVKLRGVRGPDGLVVADSRGLKESRELLAKVRADWQERIKPQPFSPFMPFRTVGVAAR